MQLRPSKQFEAAYDVVCNISQTVRSIVKKVYVHSSFENKLGAFIALCEIGELVMDAEEEVGKALKSSFSDNSLEDSM